ncbi:MAG TPA: GNAT family N-acetyltransferase [Fimbriimonadaceae bacterium]|nr:GNAT family N-acetyltransferase [Fimbriimonadaceae bacterium]
MAIHRAPEKVLLTTERLILRIPRRGDEAMMAAFYAKNRAHLQPFSPIFGEEIFTVRGWRNRIEATFAEYRNGRGLRLVLLPIEDPSRVVGVANFTSITPFPTFLCNLGYSMDDGEQGKGLMTEALRAAIEYVFQEVGLHRIEANYMPRNLASARVLSKLGFAIEGEAKDYILIDGKWEDHVRTSLTNRAWRG